MGEFAVWVTMLLTSVNAGADDSAPATIGSSAALAIGRTVDIERLNGSGRRIQGVRFGHEFRMGPTPSSSPVIHGQGIQVLYFSGHWCAPCHDASRPKSGVLNLLTRELERCGGHLAEITANGLSEAMNNKMNRPAPQTAAGRAEIEGYASAWGRSLAYPVIEQNEDESAVREVRPAAFPGIVVLVNGRIVWNGSADDFMGFGDGEAAELTNRQFIERGSIGAAGNLVSIAERNSVDLPGDCRLGRLAARRR